MENAEKQITKPAVNSVRDLIMGDAMKKQFALALPKILPVDRFLRCLITTMSRIPDLVKCDKQSVLAGAMTAAQLGLEIDPALGRAYLLPYRDKVKGMVAQLIIGYKGYVDLAYRSGQLSGLQAEVVYERDIFEYRYGLNPILNHVPCDSEERGTLKYAYAVATFSNGGNAWRVLNRSDVMSHKRRSQARDSKYSPWNTEDEPAMWRKTAIRALSSLLPLSPELRDAVATEDTVDHVPDPGIDIGEAIVAYDVQTQQEERPATAEGMAAAAEGSKNGN